MLIAQITDTHIVPKTKCWKGDSKAMTAQRLQLIVRHINALQHKPDLVIHTGDIVDKGDVESYIHAKELLDELDSKYFLACGNHDDFSNLKHIFTKHAYLSDGRFAHYVIDHLPVRVIVLDTQIKGEEYGKLCASRKKWLAETLDKSKKDTMIFLHHFPITVRDQILNDIKLLEKEDLLEILSRYENILGLYCGHYHYAAAGLFANKMCWVSPSSAPAYMFQDNQVIGLNYAQPGYSLHYCNNGQVTSHVITVG